MIPVGFLAAFSTAEPVHEVSWGCWLGILGGTGLNGAKYCLKVAVIITSAGNNLERYTGVASKRPLGKSGLQRKGSSHCFVCCD